MDTPTTSSQTSRPLAPWLRAAGRHLSAATDQALFAEGSDRREWRMLNLIDGTAPGANPGRMPHPGRAQILIDRGWAAWSDDGLSLTDRGRAAKERLGAAVAEVRERVSTDITDEDYETTVRTLEQIARNLGWTEDAPLPRRRRGRGRGHGRGAGHGHGFGHGYARGRRGHGHGRAFARDHGHPGHAHAHPGHAHGHPGHAHAAHDCGAHHDAPGHGTVEHDAGERDA